MSSAEEAATGNQFSTLFETLTKSNYLSGLALKQTLESMDSAIRTEIESKFNALAGEDSRINAVITMLQKITDAEPGSEEWDEGQNLYTLISQRYVELADKVTQNELDVADLQAMAASMASDLAAYNQSINAKVDQEITDRQAAVAALESNLDQTKNDLAAANQARTEAIATLTQRLSTEETARTEKDEQQQAEINTLKQRVTATEADVATLTAKEASLREELDEAKVEISGLKTKQNNLLTQVSKLVSYFTGLGDGAELANEFERGMKGLPSAYGHVAT